MNVHWTPEREQALKSLWCDGWSAKKIAIKLGGCSKNSVMGKVHRLNLPIRKTKYVENAARPRIVWTEEMTATLRENWAEFGCGAHMRALLNLASATIHLQAMKLGLPPRPRNHGRRGTRRQTAVPMHVPAPDSYRNVSFLELESFHCRFPMWNADADPKTYCGNDKAIGSSFCPHHHRIAWKSA